MDDSSTWQWSASIVLLLATAFFSATDAALGQLGEVRSRQLIEAGAPRARLLELWLRHPGRVHAVLTVGSTLAAAGMGAVVALASRRSGPGGLVSATLLATLALLGIGQLVPRALARRFAARTAVFAMPVVSGFSILLWPIAHGVERVGRILGARIGREDVPAVTSDDLEYLIEVGSREGAFDEVRQELLSSVLEFADRVVKEIMVPRTRMAALDRDAPPDDLLRVVTENPYSRMPVYQGTVDNVVGVLLLRDLVPDLVRGGRSVSIAKHVKTPYFVPEQMKISRLLKEMQRRKVHLAVVVDEFGGTSGIVTLEDVIEEIVGEIQDEADTEAAPVRALADGSFLAEASVPLHDLEDFLNSNGGEEGELRFPDDGDYETLGGFVTATAGRVPAVGAEVDWDGLRFTVRAGDERRVAKVEISRRPQTSEPAPEASAAEQGS